MELGKKQLFLQENGGLIVPLYWKIWKKSQKNHIIWYSINSGVHFQIHRKGGSG
jgi:hypothetical protein